MVADVVDALLGQRVVGKIGIFTGPRQQFLSLQHLEKFQQPLRRLVGRVEEIHRGVVGSGFLRHRELQKGALPHAARAKQRRATPTAPRRHRSSETRRQRENLLDAGVVHRLFAQVQVPPCDVASLMCKNPDQLIRSLCAQHQTRVDKDVLAAGDKRVDAVVGHQIDVDSVGVEPGHPPDRGHHRADVALDLGVPQQGDSAAAPVSARTLAEGQHSENQGESSGQTASNHWPRLHLPPKPAEHPHGITARVK